jgi:hypothetical protein
MDAGFAAMTLAMRIAKQFFIHTGDGRKCRTVMVFG